MTGHRRRVWTVIAGLGFVSASLGIAPVAADTSLGRIAFRSYELDGAATMDADGEDRGFLSGSSGRVKLSPDGLTVSTWQSPSGNLRLVDVASGSASTIPTTGWQSFFHGAPWSPTGARLAYANYSDVGSPETVMKRWNDIRIVTRTGTHVRKFDACPGMTRPRVRWIDWSGDDRLWVACEPRPGSIQSATTAATSERWRIFRMRPDGTGQSVFDTLRQGHELTSLAVSRDGKKVLVASRHDQTEARRTVVIEDGRSTSIPSLYGATTWSPDGKRLAGASTEGIWTARADGTDKALVPGTEPGDGDPHWSSVATCAEGIAEPANGGERILGTGGDDVLEGTSGDDVICGFGGDDTIMGLDGTDYIDGGSGDDLLDGGSGGDYLHGRSGNDHLMGGSEDDFLAGGSGRDRLEGGSGPDELDGGTGNDVLKGGSGDDELDGGSGHDTLRGGTDDDVLLGRSGDDVLYGEDGRDRLAGHGGSDTLRGGPGNDHLTGGSRKDRLEGEGGNDTIEARDGIRDVVRGGPGSDKARIDPGKDDVTSVETLLP